MQHRHASSRPCPHCDGFPQVAITTGTRDHNGDRQTIAASCPACKGTGTAQPRARLAAAR